MKSLAETSCIVVKIHEYICKVPTAVLLTELSMHISFMNFGSAQNKTEIKPNWTPIAIQVRLWMENVKLLIQNVLHMMK